MSKSKGNQDAPAAPTAKTPAPAEVEFELSLEDTLSQHRRGLAPHGQKGAVAGYNPYDTRLDSSDAKPPELPPDPKRKPTDLRKLSEWIRLQRQVEALKKQGPESDGSD